MTRTPSNPGEISISRYTSGDKVKITIEDSTSRVDFLTIEISVEDFASALFGTANRKCEFSLTNPELVGKVYEYKKVLVPVDGYKRFSEEEMDGLLSPFEVDGWKGRRYDLQNGNNHMTSGENHFYTVLFGRYIEKRSQSV